MPGYDQLREVDAPHFPLLIDLGPNIKACAPLAYNGYASNTNCDVASSRGIIPAIPHKSTDKPNFFAEATYKGRSRIDEAVGRLKWVELRSKSTKKHLRSHFHCSRIHRVKSASTA